MTVLGRPLVQGVRRAAAVLNAFLDAELERKPGLTIRALALVGFSQGAMMALHVGIETRYGLRRYRRVLGCDLSQAARSGPRFGGH